MTKICNKCGIEKPLDQFREKHNYCKKCMALEKKQWREKDKNRIDMLHKKWLKDNDEYVKNYNKKYKETHKEQSAIAKKLWDIKNKEHVLQYARDFLKTPKGKERNRRIKFRRRTLFASNICNLTLNQWEEIKKDQGYKCAHCGLELPLTQDHIIPVSKGGQHTKTNIQGLCKSCNVKKSNKIESEAMIMILTGKGGNDDYQRV